MIATPIEHLFTLQRSPIVLAPVIHQFYATSYQRDKNILLSYLVLPLILYPPMQSYLLKAKKTSNIRTLCSEPSRLVGLINHTQQFKPLTHAALLILNSENRIKIMDNLAVKSICDVSISNANPKYIEAAKKLSMVWADSDTVTIYRALGFKSL